MAGNKYSDGITLDWTNGGSAVNSGDPVAVGNRVGVAVDDIGAGETGVLNMVGVWALPLDAVTVNQGEDAYLAAGVVTNVPTGGVSAGQFWADATSGDATALVKLGPTSTPAA